MGDVIVVGAGPVGFLTALGLARRGIRVTLLEAESGINAMDDLKRLQQAGVSTFLVGESLMRQPDVAAGTRTLLGIQ